MGDNNFRFKPIAKLGLKPKAFNEVSLIKRDVFNRIMSVYTRKNADLLFFKCYDDPAVARNRPVVFLEIGGARYRNGPREILPDIRFYRQYSKKFGIRAGWRGCNRGAILAAEFPGTFANQTCS